MGEIKPFKQYLIESVESDEDSETLNNMENYGLVNTKPFDERLDKMIDEWGGDPEVNAAIRVLTSKANHYIDKWIDLNKPADLKGWDHYTEGLLELSPNELGWIEWMITGELL
jgi:hypothetical protein